MLAYLLLTLWVQQLVALSPVVDLGYAQYRGTESNSVIRWAGMRYARSVSRNDGMRFTAPQDPLPERPGQIVDANEFGTLCIGARSELKSEFGGRESEDCLFVNVFAPAKATNTSALPVYVFIQGGGFNANGNANYDGSELIYAADGQMVVVNFNYRVGPYGFLASEELASSKELSLNNGLKDQRQLLKWVQRHISKFGGDPNHVTLGGASAGAGSAVLHLTAFGGRDDSLFHAVFAESPAFPPMRNVSQSQFAYDALLKEAKCPDLTCLREMDAVKFQEAARNLRMPFPSGQDPPLYFWNPTLDHGFIQDYTFNEISAGKFVKVPSIFGDTANEGWVFTPQSITSGPRAEQFLQDQFTNLNEQEKAQILRLWEAPYEGRLDPKWKKIASDVYGHIRYTCGALNISAAIAANGSAPVWQYRWNVGEALHVSELPAIWNGGASAAAVFMQHYLVSFVRSYDPNRFPSDFSLQNGATLETPGWKEFGHETAEQKRMHFGNDNAVHMREVSPEEAIRCDALLNMGIQLEQVTSAAYRFVPSSGATGLLKAVLLGVLLLTALGCT